jgi:site-specific recombinase XerD
MDEQKSLTPYDASLGTLVAGWIHEKAGLSGSEKTKTIYQRAITSLSIYLLHWNVRLDSKPSQVRIYTQAWAALGNNVAPATFNQRLAIISSFYDYALRNQNEDAPLFESNPIAAIPRRKVQPYADTKALDTATVIDDLRKIERRDPLGIRDYALLTVLLTTGRRLHEVSSLRLHQVESRPVGSGHVVTLTFPRTKGGKTMRDTLPTVVGNALLLHIGTLRQLLGRDPDHIWLSYSNNHTMMPITDAGVAKICDRWLHTTKVHSLRHTFAHAMEESGAKISDIQARLGHSNIATTGRYLASLRRDENKHAEDIALMFRLEDRG